MNAARKAPPKAKAPAKQTGDGSLIAHLQDVVHEIVARFAGLTRRKMLVSDGWFVADKAFALVSRQARIVVRVPDPRVQDELLGLAGASPWQIANRAPMRGWIELPETMHDDEEALRTWLSRAASLTAALPSKKARTKKAVQRKRAPRA